MQRKISVTDIGHGETRKKISFILYRHIKGNSDKEYMCIVGRRK
jgi:hypothetical protein